MYLYSNFFLSFKQLLRYEGGHEKKYAKHFLVRDIRAVSRRNVRMVNQLVCPGIRRGRP